MIEVNCLDIPYGLVRAAEDLNIIDIRQDGLGPLNVLILPFEANAWRISPAVVLDVLLHRECDLFQVALAGGSTAPFTHRAEDGEKYGRNHCDDGDHDEQFDESEPGATHRPTDVVSHLILYLSANVDNTGRTCMGSAEGTRLMRVIQVDFQKTLMPRLVGLVCPTPLMYLRRPLISVSVK